jgi:hypothetical protein
MRRGNDPQFLIEDGKMVALDLGSDYCAEHEWGIKDLKVSFGITDEDVALFGIAKRRIVIVHDALQYHSKGKEHFLICWDHISQYNPPPAPAKISDLYLSKDKELACAWDSKSFGIKVIGDQNKEYLHQLHNAFQKKDIAIWLGGGAVFQNAGLVIGIISNIPEASLKTMYDADIDKYNLIQASNKTGIIKRLKQAGKKYFACSPGWKLKSTAQGEIQTAYEVMYFLNPEEQDQNNGGWVTVEDLDAWIEGNGPIPKVSKLEKVILTGDPNGWVIRKENK